jgi:hypothetical protein
MKRQIRVYKVVSPKDVPGILDTWRVRCGKKEIGVYCYKMHKNDIQALAKAAYDEGYRDGLMGEEM